MNHRTDVALEASPPRYHVDYIPGSNPTIDDERGAWLALMVSQPYRTEAQAVESARLFAASPHLLAVCKRARHWAEQQPPTVGGEGTFALIAALDHVIALATGGKEG